MDLRGSDGSGCCSLSFFRLSSAFGEPALNRYSKRQHSPSQRIHIDFPGNNCGTSLAQTLSQFSQSLFPQRRLSYPQGTARYSVCQIGMADWVAPTRVLTLLRQVGVGAGVRSVLLADRDFYLYASGFCH